MLIGFCKVMLKGTTLTYETDEKTLNIFSQLVLTEAACVDQTALHR